MPLYDYDCAHCGRRFEVIHGVHVHGPTACPLCGGGPVRKTIGAPAVHFKGSGWAKKERRPVPTAGNSKTSGGSSGDGASGDGSFGDGASTASDGEPAKGPAEPVSTPISTSPPSSSADD